MINLDALKEAARIVKDEKGDTVVQIPLPVWEQLVGAVPSDEDLPQHERIKALLREWQEHPDDTPDQWWDEFEEFLKENRVNFPERDLGLDD